jgi:hypothetical protein
LWDYREKHKEPAPLVASKPIETITEKKDTVENSTDETKAN